MVIVYYSYFYGYSKGDNILGYFVSKKLHFENIPFYLWFGVVSLASYSLVIHW